MSLLSAPLFNFTVEKNKKCPSRSGGEDGTGRHHGKKVWIYLSDVKLRACSNHLPVYLLTGWRKLKKEKVQVTEASNVIQ